MSPGCVRSYSRADLRSIANAFLDRHWQIGTIPIDIEEIADIALGLDLIPIPSLLHVFGVDAYLSISGKSIVYDSAVHEHRRRFTIAHEIGHLLLHKDIIEENRIDSVEDYLVFRNSISDVLSVYERQANQLAGYLLVPPPRLELESRLIMRQAESHVRLDLENPEMRDTVARAIGRVFGVSGTVIDIRCVDDGLWARLTNPT